MYENPLKLNLSFLFSRKEQKYKLSLKNILIIQEKIVILHPVWKKYIKSKTKN